MPRILDDENRELACEFATKWGANPADLLWDGALHFRQIAPYVSPGGPQFVWEYREVQRDSEGSMRRDVDGPLFEKRQRPIPEEWIEEYEAAVKELYKQA